MAAVPPHFSSHPKNPVPSRFPPVKCTKMLFINNERNIWEDKEIIKNLTENYGYTLIGSDVLREIKKYLKTKTDGNVKGEATYPSFCRNALGEGMSTAYLYANLKEENTRVMICYNEAASKPFSIIIYYYDIENNCVYVKAFCANQTIGDENKGSGTLLLHDLINAVSDTEYIDSIFLNTVPAADTFYMKQGFVHTGDQDEEQLPEMTLNLDSHAMSDMFAKADKSAKAAKADIGKKTSPKGASPKGASPKGASPKGASPKGAYIKLWNRGVNLRAAKPKKKGGASNKKRKVKAKSKTKKAKSKTKKLSQRLKS